MSYDPQEKNRNRHRERRGFGRCCCVHSNIDGDDMTDTFEIRGHEAKCPICDRFVDVRGHFDRTGLWGHYFSKKHLDARPKGEESANAFKEKLIRTINTSRRQIKAMMKAQKESERLQAVEEAEQPHRKHVVTGAFLMDIAAEIESLCGMMEPYYSQGDCADDGFELVNRLEGIINSKGMPV